MIVILDSGILGLLTNPLENSSKSEDTEVYECMKWFQKLLIKHSVAISEISDYEVRRELIRIKSRGLEILDSLRKENIDFFDITPEVLQRAAEFWAEARQNHIKTADDKNIDADMIIAAQWSLLKEENRGRAVLIATTNLKHLRIFAQDDAQEWRNIKI